MGEVCHENVSEAPILRATCWPTEVLSRVAPPIRQGVVLLCTTNHRVVFRGFAGSMRQPSSESLLGRVYQNCTTELSHTRVIACSLSYMYQWTQSPRSTDGHTLQKENASHVHDEESDQPRVRPRPKAISSTRKTRGPIEHILEVAQGDLIFSVKRIPNSERVVAVVSVRHGQIDDKISCQQHPPRLIFGVGKHGRRVSHGPQAVVVTYGARACPPGALPWDNSCA